MPILPPGATTGTPSAPYTPDTTIDTLGPPLGVDDSPVSPKPEGYIFEAVPRSAPAAASATAETRVRQTAKSAIVHYLQKFLTPQGPYRYLTKLSVPFAGQFVTEVSGAADPKDPSIINVQLARLSTSLRTQLPCILVIDTTYRYKMSGTFGLERGRRVKLPYGHDKQHMIVQNVLVTLGVQIMMAAASQSEASDLVDLMAMVLGPLTHYVRGHLIQPSSPTDKWEVRLPLRFETSNLERRPISDDPKDSLWATSIDMEIEFEGQITHGIDSPVQSVATIPGDGSVPGIPEAPGLQITPFVKVGCYGLPSEADEGPAFAVPSEMTLREFPRAQVLRRPSRTILASDNPRVAYADNTTGIIYPRSPGTFNLILLQEISPHAEPVVLLTKSLRVRP